MKIYYRKEQIVHECTSDEFEKLLMVSHIGWFLFPLRMHGEGVIEDTFGLDLNEYSMFSLEQTMTSFTYKDENGDTYMQRMAKHIQSKLPFKIEPMITNLGDREKMSLFVAIKK